ncbi:winged helix-turn-helix domain-containing protein, partial [Staphylococcus haemolyticus]
MKNKEQFILNEIKKNPFITQQELAERIGLSRPATANIISGL